MRTFAFAAIAACSAAFRYDANNFQPWLTKEEYEQEKALYSWGLRTIAEILEFRAPHEVEEE